MRSVCWWKNSISIVSCYTFDLRSMPIHMRLVGRARLGRFGAWFSSSTSSCAGASPDETLHYPEPPTSQHQCLDSFLQYAKRTGLDPASTIYVGTHFEYTVMKSLSRYGFSLRRVGGVSDYGIDLLGTWTVPSSTTPLKVLLQCKAMSRKALPHHIRELEGAFVGAPTGWRGRNVVGFLATQQPASKGVRESLGRSRWPMGFITCSQLGQVQQMLWNVGAVDQGLSNLGVTMQHGAKGDSQVALSFRGAPIAPRRLSGS
ncbi:hypothetical protein MAPG_00898 [Magnaporthiopsis poae ATCC 64411]|uniref:Restriction endonuclease type IV Mrr domain-containing protein n=1 Tax=Magnaporthiopsis poae (strain ATCC 64411 / 73-15) TaxID=644358 RepID=A0A0C4DM95_MAGP6|nr:hypothetical protein MAPG_00898 [Magnaporthiopsis poae ATCC 64411]